MVSATFGNEDYANGHVRLGGKGLLLDYVRKQGDGARHNLEHADRRPEPEGAVRSDRLAGPDPARQPLRRGFAW